MLSLLALFLIPALAWAADEQPMGPPTSEPILTAVASNSTSGVIASASALPTCAITCTLKIAPMTACTNPANTTCSCTDLDFTSKVADCYQKSCDAAEFNSTVTIGRGICAAAGFPQPGTSGSAATTASNTQNTTGTGSTTKSHTASVSVDGKTASAGVSHSGSNSRFHAVSASLMAIAFGVTVFFACS